MIVFGICIGERNVWEEVARPALDRVREPSSVVLSVRGAASIFEAYNELLERASHLDDLEALVLFHDDLEITDVSVSSKLRQSFCDPEVGAVGPIGALGPNSIDWWRSGTRIGRAPGLDGEHVGTQPSGTVDTLDGIFIALSPWVVRNVRYDTTRYQGFHGYDAELCSQIRSLGKRIVVVDLDTFHHSKGGRGDIVAWRRADLTWRARWRPLPSWKRAVLRARARHAHLEVWFARRIAVTTHWLKATRSVLAAKVGLGDK